MFEASNPEGDPAMTVSQINPVLAVAKDLFSQDSDGLRQLIQTVVQEVLEAEMSDALGAAKGERRDGRRGYRSGSYPRTIITRVGKIELRVPQDRDGHFSTELFQRHQRSEQALVASLAQMYVQGVSTRKVKAITEELCGHSFSASAISEINAKLDESLAAFASRPLEEPFPYLILDARHEKVRESGVVRSMAVQIAIGMDWEGRRQILAVETANRESRSSWRDFLLKLKQRGLHGVEYIVADDHAGLRAAVRETCTDAYFQRCYVHFLRNALDHLPRKADTPQTYAASCAKCSDDGQVGAASDRRNLFDQRNTAIHGSCPFTLTRVNGRCTRLQTHSDPKCDDDGERDGGQDVAGELVVAGGDAPEILEAAECIFDEMAVAVSRFVEPDLFLAVAASGDDRPGLLAPQARAKCVAVIALVGDQRADARPILHEQLGGLDGAGIAGREAQREGPPDHICGRMDFRCLAAA